MGVNSDVTKQIAEAPKLRTLPDLIRESTKELARALPKHLTAERITRIALTCIRLNPDLSRCTPESFMGSLFTAAQLGLEPVGGRAYLIPFKKNFKVGNDWKSRLECQLVIGYKGLADLFYRHEKAVELAWGTVHEKDDFTYQYGTESFLKHVPARGDRGQVVGFYVVAKLERGGRPFMYMTREACMDHGMKHSKTWDSKSNTFYKNTPWATSPDSMCLKTVLIQLAKLLPLSIELQQAIQADETSRNFRDGIDSALDIPPEPFEAEIVKDEAAGTAQEPTTEEAPALGAKA